MCDVAASHHPSMLSSPERHIRRVSHEPGAELDSATPSDDDAPRSPPQLGVSHQGLAPHRPQPSPSIAGQYDFAWDESPAPRASPRLAFNNRSLLKRYDCATLEVPKTWKNVEAVGSIKRKRHVPDGAPRVLTPEPADDGAGPMPKKRLSFDAMSDDEEEEGGLDEPHRCLVNLLWGLPPDSTAPA